MKRLYNCPIEEKELFLSDVLIECNHPAGKRVGYLKYEDDVLVLKFEGGIINLPDLTECKIKDNNG